MIEELLIDDSVEYVLDCCWVFLVCPVQVWASYAVEEGEGLV